MTRADDMQGQIAPIDGRRQRTVDSRARIIAAMLDLTEEGHVSVSAELVADRARVGLRTVFRHFKDMDSLYREMSLNVGARLRAEVSFEFTADTWRGRLVELVDRRATVFEKIAPWKRAEAAHRHRSKALEDDTRRLNDHLREVLRLVLPGSVAKDVVVFEALDLLLSFETWERLRRGQSLSPAEARGVLEAAIGALLANQVTAARTA